MRTWVAAILLACSVPALAAPRVLEPAGSEIAFSVKQMGVPVSGKFTRFDASIVLDAAKPEASSAEIAVDVASLTTGDGDADAIALDKPWLDKLGFPKATFKSSSVRALGPGSYEAKGTLTIRGKSRAITVPFKTQDKADKRTVVTGSFTIKRVDFGIGGGEWNEGDLVAADVPVTFKLTLAPPR
jgi:polyisoprenoid-binding protein YceI